MEASEERFAAAQAEVEALRRKNGQLFRSLEQWSDIAERREADVHNVWAVVFPGQKYPGSGPALMQMRAELLARRADNHRLRNELQAWYLKEGLREIEEEEAGEVVYHPAVVWVFGLVVLAGLVWFGLS